MIPNLLTYLSFALTIGGLIGGFFVLRKNNFKESSDIQEQTINALKVRVETLEAQARDYAEKLRREQQIMVTVRHALKRRGLHIEIENDFVTLIDADGQRNSTQVPPVARVRPVKLQPIDPDNDTDAS